MKGIQLPIEVSMLKEEIFFKIQSDTETMGYIHPYPSTPDCCNLERHKAWSEYLDPVIVKIVEGVVSVINIEVEISIRALEERINIWNSIFEIRERHCAENFRKAIKNLPDMLNGKDRRVVISCMKEFFHVENAYDYKSIEYIDKHYIGKIHSLYRRDSFIKLKMLIAERLITLINIPGLIKKDCEAAGFSLLKREEDFFVIL